jgi:hypothetical protein
MENRQEFVIVQKTDFSKYRNFKDLQKIQTGKKILRFFSEKIPVYPVNDRIDRTNRIGEKRGKNRNNRNFLRKKKDFLTFLLFCTKMNKIRNKFMSKQYFVLYERSNKVKSGPHSTSDIINMSRNRTIRKATPIRDEDGYILEAEFVIDDLLLSPRQRAFLRFLGYSGSFYISQDECSDIIETLKYNQKNKPKKSFEEYVDEEKNNQQYYDIFGKVVSRKQTNTKKPIGCLRRFRSCLTFILLFIILMYILFWLGVFL